MCLCNEANHPPPTQLSDTSRENHDADKSNTLSPRSNNNKTTNTKVLQLLQELSPKELELAARTDYRYLTHQTNDREGCAGHMAQRYLHSKKSPHRALPSLRATLEFRTRRSIDAMRTVHCDQTNLVRNGNAFVTGHDRSGRSTLVFIPRLVNDHEGSVEGLLWTLERAIACCTHQNAEINAVVDFGGFEMWKHTPPISVGKRILTMLRNHYVGHVHRIYFLRAPSTVHYLWKTFQAFAGQKTKDKIAFVTSADLEQSYDTDQLPASIMASGIRPEFDAETYFGVTYDGL